MSESPDIQAEAARLDRLCREKASAELDAAESEAKALVAGSGDTLAEVLLLKGEPGHSDVQAKAALAGADGEAVGKALDALGMPEARYAACSAAKGTRAQQVRRLRLLVEAVDPRAVVLLDPRAAADFGEAFGVPAPEPGILTTVLGRHVVATDDFSASLGDEKTKRRVWRQLKALEQLKSE